MYRTISLIIVAVLVAMASMTILAQSVHKWIDANGVTHYSDEAPPTTVTQASLIEIPANYSTNAEAEDDYYSITNQWMRLHDERIAMEKIKLEKAQQKAAAQPAVPQDFYLNEPYENRYIVGYPNFIYGNDGRGRFHRKTRRDFRGIHAMPHRRGHSGKFQGQGRAIRSHSHQKSRGVALKIR